MGRRVMYSKDIVAKYNIPYATLTHYTNLGFFTVVARRGNKRLYDEGEVKTRLEQIRIMTNEGYPLRLIRKKLQENRGLQ